MPASGGNPRDEAAVGDPETGGTRQGDSPVQFQLTRKKLTCVCGESRRLRRPSATAEAIILTEDLSRKSGEPQLDREVEGDEPGLSRRQAG